ncbi:DUF6183 family protein [Streptomyces sp. NPDC057950]|uniref:DUF6183 family protein n=1 Tax=Streptomyces sp. NPDC057950 TaxID=3346288 RepID=UPI0036EF956E
MSLTQTPSPYATKHAFAPVVDTARLVEQAHWFIVDPSSDWFHHVAWDLAVAVLRPGGQGIAVLAATDTD